MRLHCLANFVQFCLGALEVNLIIYGRGRPDALRLSVITTIWILRRNGNSHMPLQRMQRPHIRQGWKGCNCMVPFLVLLCRLAACQFLSKAQGFKKRFKHSTTLSCSAAPRYGCMGRERTRAVALRTAGKSSAV